jgi:hypothetical protein
MKDGNSKAPTVVASSINENIPSQPDDAFNQMMGQFGAFGGFPGNHWDQPPKMPIHSLGD